MSRLLFVGDSVTDCGRTFTSPDRVAPGALGDGWVRIVAALLGHRRPGAYEVLNAGVSGDRVGDLLPRWDRDVAGFAPEVLTVLVGVNDVLLAPRTPLDRLAEQWAAVVDAVPPSVERLVIAEPFVLPVDAERAELADALRPVLEVIRDGAARRPGAQVLPFGERFAAACAAVEPAWWAEDGVHPSAAGHGLIAEAWLEAVGLP